MTILHIAASLDTGGAERQLYLLCRQTQGRVENRVTAIARGGRWAEPLRETGAAVEILGCGMRDPRAIARLAVAIRRSGADAVHCWLPSVNLVGALVAGGRPVIASIRNVDDWKPWYYRLAEDLVSPLWSAVVANSHAGAAEAVRQGIQPDKLRVVPNGIEPRTPLTRLRRSKTTICAVSRLVAQKRVDRIVGLARELPEAVFLVAGDGPQRADLAAAAGPNVTFLGEQEDPAWLFASADFFVQTSVREGTSNSLLEAMQAGCVPVVTAAGDNERIVAHGVSGWVGPVEGMADAITALGPRWEALSEAAQNAVRGYSVEAMAARTIEIYRKVIQHAPGNANPIPGLHQ
ncbi:MAG: glycosyltransferase [Bryobacteraceae bacterium]